MKFSLIGINGNAYNVMGYVVSAMKKCNATKEQINEYQKDATSSDYYHLLAVSQDRIDWCNKEIK